MKDWSTESRK